MRRGEFLTVDQIAGLQPPDHLADQIVGDFGQPAGLLVQHRQSHGLAAFNPAAVGFDGPGDQPEQSRLSRAVGADDAGPLARGDPPLHVSQHRFRGTGFPRPGFPRPGFTCPGFPIGHRHIQQIDDVLAQPGGGQLRQFDGVAQRRHIGDELVGRVDPELRFGGTGRGSPAQPGQFLAHQVLSLGLAGGRDPIPFHPLQDVGGVTAVERIDQPPFIGGVNLPGGGGDLVEEPPVMGDDQQPPGVAGPAPLEVGGQPGDALDVEMVGGLIQGDDVPVLDQQRRQLDTTALPAGERCDCGVPIQVGHQARNDVAHPRLAGPFMFRPIADQGGADGVGRVEGVGLFQCGHPQPTAAGDPPGIGLDPPGEHAQQAGLAVAVASDDPDPVAVIYPDRHAVEHDLRRVLQTQAFAAQQVCHRQDLTNR